MRKIITEILRELGVRDFAEADDGRSALAVMEKFEPDIVFIDNKMMPMDGVEFTRRVRAGIEGVLSFLSRCFGLARCTWKGLAHFKSYVWGSVVSANLLILARHRLARAAPPA